MTRFEEYKMIHEFMYPNELLKGWINDENYSNNYKYDFQALMEIIKKIIENNRIKFQLDFNHIQKKCFTVSVLIFLDDMYNVPLSFSHTHKEKFIEATYLAVIQTLKYLKSNGNT